MLSEAPIVDPNSWNLIPKVCVSVHTCTSFHLRGKCPDIFSGDKQTFILLFKNVSPNWWSRWYPETHVEPTLLDHKTAQSEMIPVLLTHIFSMRLGRSVAKNKWFMPFSSLICQSLENEGSLKVPFEYLTQRKALLRYYSSAQEWMRMFSESHWKKVSMCFLYLEENNKIPAHECSARFFSGTE